MIGVVPYYPPFSITLFDIPLDSWSLLVALGFVVGIEFAEPCPATGYSRRMLWMVVYLSLAWGLLLGICARWGVQSPYDRSIWMGCFLAGLGRFFSNGGFVGAYWARIVVYVYS